MKKIAKNGNMNLSYLMIQLIHCDDTCAEIEKQTNETDDKALK